MNADSVPEASALDYLHYGYLPDPHATADDFVAARMAGPEPPRRDRGAGELVREAGSVLQKVFRESIAAHGSRPLHVVPISGGVDSRAVLAGLLENLDRRQIVTFTYGTPGTWDFELGRRVAKHLSVEHHAFDLTSNDWSWDLAGLRATAEAAARPSWVFDRYVRRRLANEFGNEALFWTGYLGDVLGRRVGDYALGGRPYQKKPSWSAAREVFAKEQRFIRGFQLAPLTYDPTRSLPASPLADRELLGFDDQLDFCVRHACYVRQVSMPEGSLWCAPFLHPEWVSFMLRIPRELREGENTLYNRTVCALYPTAFSVPTRNAYGLRLGASQWKRQAKRFWVRGTRKLMRHWGGPSLEINYVDFDKAIRTRTDLAEAVETCLGELEASGAADRLGLPVNELWADHQRGRRDLGTALTLLASLAIELSVGDRAWTFD